MYETIPLMEQPEVRTAYAQHLRQQLGEDSLWKIGAATFTPGLIANPNKEETIKKNGAGLVERMYIMGIAKTTEKPEMRGLGLAVAREITTTEFYKVLTGERGYTAGSEGTYLLKPLDTTEQLVNELKDLEALVFLREDFVI
ncbi:MAG: hypothetical protein WCV90_05725 [Candidatus Woesearchaeota archaeon]|jgi:hypothetical protein